jgi:hypothetical protein
MIPNSITIGEALSSLAALEYQLWVIIVLLLVLAVREQMS